MKQVPIDIKISDFELECFEKLLTTIPLCIDHAKAFLLTEEIKGIPLESMYLHCKHCRRIHDLNWKRAWFIYSRLRIDYLKKIGVL
jgi:hypothetical protein